MTLPVALQNPLAGDGRTPMVLRKPAYMSPASARRVWMMTCDVGDTFTEPARLFSSKPAHAIYNCANAVRKTAKGKDRVFSIERTDYATFTITRTA
jgi:hypothetical protein